MLGFLWSKTTYCLLLLETTSKSFVLIFPQLLFATRKNLNENIENDTIICTMYMERLIGEMHTLCTKRSPLQWEWILLSSRCRWQFFTLQLYFIQRIFCFELFSFASHIKNFLSMVFVWSAYQEEKWLRGQNSDGLIYLFTLSWVSSNPWDMRHYLRFSPLLCAPQLVYV